MIHPNKWLPADGLILEPNALRAATEQQRSLALTAGPGAGKTEMLAQRADFLLRTGTSPYPKRILAISFKVDASKNLKERVRHRCGREKAARFDSHTFHAFAKRIIDRFRPQLTGVDTLDVGYTIDFSKRIPRRQITFDDLVPLAIQILESSVVARNAIRQTYSDVFLDEFQDCTNHQYRLIKAAFEGTPIRLTAVGDIKQRIMGWAGALEGVFQSFEADFHALDLHLYRNFRSQPQLLRMQNEIIRVLDPASVMADELIQGGGGEINLSFYESSLHEAQAVSECIADWVNTEMVKCSDIAVLVAKQPELYTTLLMQALEQRGIPYRNEQQLQDISNEPIAQLIVDYLLALCGAREPSAYARLMNILTQMASDEEEHAVFVQSWGQFIKAERKKAKKADIFEDELTERWELVMEFLTKFGRPNIVALSSEYESSERLQQLLAETKTRVEELWERSGRKLMEGLALFSDENAVRIMTIHKSKGLEFDSVVMLGIERETFWGDELAERCAFFVGVSRAKRRLWLTVSHQRVRPLSFSGRWAVSREQHDEFIGYSKPFVVL